jgi:hypothetical protein
LYSGSILRSTLTLKIARLLTFESLPSSAKAYVISNSIISQDSDIQGGGLALCDVKGYTVCKAVFCETLMLNCKVSNCNINLYGYHGCKMPRTLKLDCKAVLTLRVFPPEIRSVVINTLNLEGRLLPTHMPLLTFVLRPKTLS